MEVTKNDAPELNIEHFQNLIEQVRDVIFSISPQGLLVSLNKSFEHITGWNVKEWIGKPITDLICEEDIPLASERIASLLNGKTDNAVELRIRKKSGDYFAGEVLATPQMNDGKITGLLGIVRDITQRKQSDALLRKLNRTYALLSEVNRAIIRGRSTQELFDEVCKISVEKGGFRMAWVGLMNPLTGQVTPVSSAGVTGDYLERLQITMSDKERGQGPTATAMRTGSHSVSNDISSDPRMAPWRINALSNGYFSSAVFPFVIETKFMGTLNLYAPVANFFDEEELALFDEMAANISFAMKIANEEVQRKRAETELLVAKDKAEESDRLKTALLLNISHEFRTPLNGILGFGEILTETVNDPKHRKMVNTIVLLGHRLLHTFTSMLKLSQLEAENLKPTYAICNFSELVKEMLVYFKPRADVKSIEIRETIEKDVILTSDKAMLKDILFFLIDNAIKFTHSGCVWITLQKGFENGGEKIEFKVRDTGIGIEKGQLDIIFQAFRQVSEGFGRNYEGTGLGLTLSNRFASLLGGEIQVESELGSGSVFTLVFKTWQILHGSLTTVEQTGINVINSHERINSKTESPVKVLVVEDNEANVELVLLYLGKKFNADIATSGKEAVRCARQNDYDLILMDINLGSDMDGIQATKEIRSMKNYSSVPIIAVTGYSTKEEKERILGQGLDDFLSKPFTVNELLTVISHWIKKPGGG